MLYYVLVTLVIVFVRPAIADDSSFEARKARARELLEQRDYEGALGVARSVHREWMDDVVTYQLMAEARLGLGDYAAAESDIQWMLDLREGKADARGWWLVAQFREVTVDLEGAIEAIATAVSRLPSRKEPDALKVFSYAGHLYAAQGRREQAISILTELAKTSDDPRQLYLLAQMTGDYRSFEAAARARSSESRNANRELVLYLAGPGKKPAEALEIAQREAARRRDIGTLGALAAALAANGKTDDARIAIQKALATGTRDPEILALATRLGAKHE